MKGNRILFFLIAFFSFILSSFLFSQAPKSHIIDSLETALNKAKEDTSKVRTYNQLSLQYSNSDPEKAKKINSEGYKLAVKLNDKKGLGNVFHIYGLIANVQGNPDSALYFHSKALELRKEIKWKRGIGISTGNVAQGYFAKGDFQNALKFFITASTIAEEISDSVMCAGYYNNLGLVNNSIRDYDKALWYLKKALAIKERIADPKSIGSTIINIGLVYNNKKQFGLAKTYYENALSKYIEVNNKQGQSICYNNIGGVLYDLKDYNGALSANLKSLAIKESMSDQAGIAASYLNIGSDYYALSNIAKAKENHLKAVALMQQLGLNAEQIIAFEMLSKDYEAENDIKNALFYYKKYEAMKDTVFNIEKSDQLTEMQTKYDTEKKDKEIIQKNSELKEKDLETKQKETQRNAFIGGFLLVLVLMGFVFNSYQQKKKANIEINKQKEIITQQKHIVEENQKEIIDSINYAKRIQYTLLANAELLQKNLNDHFVLFKPKDIVSGDFYWAAKKDNRFYLAVCDSTGHGVPGAFMSLLNISFLNEAINEKNIVRPNEILDHVRRQLIENISKDGAQDGMDAVLLCFDGSSVTYAAANNAPMVIINNELHALACDKMPVGKGERKEPFTLYDLQTKKGDVVYLYTDGYADQFGGAKGKKFKYKQLNELLLLTHHHPFQKQKEDLDTAFENWRGNLEQVDDVCIIGIKI